MKNNFQEIIKQKTDKELEIISKDYVFYSEEERLIALDELKSRNGLSEELVDLINDIEDSKEIEEEDAMPRHKFALKDLFPQKNYLFTPLLIYINIFIFALMVLFGMNIFNPKTNELIQWGGNIRCLTIHGQPWRLLTSIFLHSGILHLLFNMYALLYAGSILERAIGKNKFIFAYLVSGIAASVTSLIAHENIVSVGASGAIFGLFGVLLSLLIFKAINFSTISTKNLLLNTTVFVLYNIGYGFTKSGIDNAAHIGGLLGGFIIGILYCLIIKGKLKFITASIISVITLSVFSALAITNVSDKIGEYDSKMFDEKTLAQYDEKMKEFARMESMALEVFSLPEETAKGLILHKLQSRGIYYWNENLKLIDSLDKWNLPLQLKEQDAKLKEYCELRIKSYELIYKMISEDTDKYSVEIADYNSKIEKLIKELTKKK